MGNLESTNDRLVLVWDFYTVHIHDLTGGFESRNFGLARECSISRSLSWYPMVVMSNLLILVFLSMRTDIAQDEIAL